MVGVFVGSVMMVGGGVFRKVERKVFAVFPENNIQKLNSKTMVLYLL